MTAIAFPTVASAKETINTEININNTVEYFSQLLTPEESQARELFQAIANKLEQDKKITSKNEKILALWKEKQLEKWNNLPKQPFAINASAYTAAADECGNSKGITASGIKVEAKRTIACPPEFPFGAKIKIADLGTFVCEDRGGAIKGNHIDIYVQTKKEAFAFGRQNLIAEVVE